MGPFYVRGVVLEETAPESKPNRLWISFGKDNVVDDVAWV